jgi:hypothetical protein
VYLMALHGSGAKKRTEDHFGRVSGNWKEIRSRADGDYSGNSV